jgi:hypothetical protein
MNEGIVQHLARRNSGLGMAKPRFFSMPSRLLRNPFEGLGIRESLTAATELPRRRSLGIPVNRMVDRPRVGAARSGYRKRRLRKV